MRLRSFRYLLLLLLATPELFGEEILFRTVDRLKRPVPDVRVEVSCTSGDKELAVLHLVSAADGLVHGNFQPFRCTPDSIGTSKEGYVWCSSGYRAEYVVERKFRARDLLPVLHLAGDGQRTALRELLAGDFGREWEQFQDSVFQNEERLQPILRDLTQDLYVTERASNLLSLIGESEDLHLIVQLTSPPRNFGLPERWRYPVATALINPDSEAEWHFLRRCALNQFDDGWVDAGAIQTLKLTASPRSRELLEGARVVNPKRAWLIDEGLRYVAKTPTPLVDADLARLAKRVARAVAIGAWKGNDKPRFNKAGDKALVNITHIERQWIF